VEGEPLACQARSLQEWLKIASIEIPRIHRFAQGIGEGSIVVLPPAAFLQPLFVLVSLRVRLLLQFFPSGAGTSGAPFLWTSNGTN
jgi:hypothetical protein